MTSKKFTLALLLGTSLTATAQADGLQRSDIRRVLLISIDGMHSVDLINCVSDLPGVNGGASYCPTLAALKQSGLDYVDAQTSRPSDSFPGLTAIVTGGTPRTVGAYYDVAGDRTLQPRRRRPATVLRVTRASACQGKFRPAPGPNTKKASTSTRPGSTAAVIPALPRSIP